MKNKKPTVAEEISQFREYLCLAKNSALAMRGSALHMAYNLRLPLKKRKIAGARGRIADTYMELLLNLDRLAQEIPGADWHAFARAEARKRKNESRRR